MVLPSQPVTLTPEQIDSLNRDLSAMRHDINNNLSLVMAALELIRCRPEKADQMLATISQQPTRINDSLKKFSATFEHTLGITRS